MNNKFFKFHFKNDKTSRGTSCHKNFDDFSDAMSFAYNYLDELNTKASGYRIVGIYEILYTHNSPVPSELN
tara:strand:- start:495 stop:707 length:213 start_codon:yes stop_codon:yes gene_type:complete